MDSTEELLAPRLRAYWKLLINNDLGNEDALAKTEIAFKIVGWQHPPQELFGKQWFLFAGSQGAEYLFYFAILYLSLQIGQQAFFMKRITTSLDRNDAKRVDPLAADRTVYLALSDELVVSIFLVNITDILSFSRVFSVCALGLSIVETHERCRPNKSLTWLLGKILTGIIAA